LKTGLTKDFVTQDLSPVTAIAHHPSTDSLCFTDRNDFLYVANATGDATALNVVALPSDAEYDRIKLSDDGKFAICWESIGRHPIALTNLDDRNAAIIEVDGEKPHCEFLEESGAVAIGTQKGLFVTAIADHRSIRVISQNSIFGIERVPGAILTLESQVLSSATDDRPSQDSNYTITRLVHREPSTLNDSKSEHVPGTPRSLHVNHDRTIALIGTRQWPARIWQLSDTRKSSDVLLLPAPIVAHKFSRDSQNLTVISSDGTTLRYDLKSKRKVLGRVPEVGSVAVCDVSEDGNLILAADDSGRTSAILKQNRVFSDMTVKESDSIPRGIKISPDGRKAAIFSATGMTVWDKLDGEPRSVNFLPSTEVLHVLWQNDSKTLFSITQPPQSNSNSITCIDTEQRIISSLEAPNDAYCLFPYPGHNSPGIVTLTGSVLIPGKQAANGDPKPQYQQIIDSGVIRSSAGATTDEIVVSTNEEYLVLTASSEPRTGPVSYRVRTNDRVQVRRKFPWNECSLQQRSPHWLLHITIDTVERWPRDLRSFSRNVTSGYRP
jgi:hypothetical protein